MSSMDNLINSNLGVGLLKPYDDAFSVYNSIKRFSDAIEKAYGSPVLDFQKKMQTISPKIIPYTTALEQLSQSIKQLTDSKCLGLTDTLMNFSNYVKDLTPNTSEYFKVIDWTSLIRNLDYSINDNDEHLSTNEVQETSQLITDLASEDPDTQLNANERFHIWEEKKKIQFSIILRILKIIAWISSPVIAATLAVLWSPVTSKIESPLRSEPSAKSKIITSIPKDEQCIIINNTNYYYQVYYVDSNNCDYTGWIPKRNVKLIETQDDELINDDESDNIPVPDPAPDTQ